MPVSVHTHHNISDITTCVVRDATMCADIPNTTIGDNTGGAHAKAYNDNALWGGTDSEVITKF